MENPPAASLSGGSVSHGFEVCWRALDFPHRCDLCGQDLPVPFIVTRCNHCFCYAHLGEPPLRDGTCAACGSRLSRRSVLHEVARQVARRFRLLYQTSYFGVLLPSFFGILALGLGWLGTNPLASFLWAGVVPRLWIAVVIFALLASIDAWHRFRTRPVRLCMMGDRAVGKSTVGRFLESALDVGPVFAPRQRRTRRARPESFLMTTGSATSAILIEVGSALDVASAGGGGGGGGGPVNASSLTAIRLGDAHERAIADDDDEDDEEDDDEDEDEGRALATRWHNVRAARRRQSARSSIAGLLAEQRRHVRRADGLLLIFEMPSTERGTAPAAAEPAIDSAATADGANDGTATAIDVAATGGDAMDSWVPWYAARQRLTLKRACKEASAGARPLLLLFSKVDLAPPTECRRKVERLCERLGVRHGSEGPTCFVHATSRAGGALYLPEEIRRRIFEAAMSDGPSDAAAGRTLRLASGSALRVVAGGVIGRGSAARLREGMAWLSEESRDVRRAQTTRRGAEMARRIAAALPSLRDVAGAVAGLLVAYWAMVATTRS